MTDDLDALAKLAEAATRAWDVMEFRISQDSTTATVDAHAAFIAACDPATITRLIQRVKEAERNAVLLSSRGTRAEQNTATQRARADAAEARVAELEAERDLLTDAISLLRQPMTLIRWSEAETPDPKFTVVNIVQYVRDTLEELASDGDELRTLLPPNDRTRALLAPTPTTDNTTNRT